ncbi:ROK family protein [Actinobacillus minor]|uniref:ROK family protein n=1 Tax=Actinobacillus minor TaxID=51047 RepID=UPI0002F00084|nr:ROK family protein [Actinobacillus minor]
MTENRIQNIGTIYRLIEQFELISRTDLAKLAGLAPASITNITKALIDKQFIIERTAQDSISRGRPAVGLSVSPFFWRLLCLTISSEKIHVSLCELNGTPLYTENYTVSSIDYPSLDTLIMENLQDFQQKYPLANEQLLAISVCVVGKIDADKRMITELGGQQLHCPLMEKLESHFTHPILLNEHFHLWLLAESTVGSLISDDNVIFLQLDESINLSVLMRGALLYQQSKMNVDKMLMPKFSPLSDQIFPELDEIQRYQLTNQVTFSALIRLIDLHLPNTLKTNQEKINFLCEQIEQQNEQALLILNHISDNLAYVLMNLINIFATQKVLFDSPLLKVKQVLFEQITEKLQKTLLIDNLNIQLVTSQFEWNNEIIPCSAIKQGIYEGSLIKDIN